MITSSTSLGISPSISLVKSANLTSDKILKFQENFDELTIKAKI